MTETARILLVEDEEIIAIVIRDLLVAEGFEVTICENGVDAWQSLQAAADGFELVLLDLELPLMNGMQLLGRIKSNAAFARIPVIMQTAHSDKQSIQEGLSQGAYYYLTKPVQPEILLAVINAALEQSRELAAMLETVSRAEQPLSLMKSGSFCFRNLEEGRLLANYLAKACPDPERVIQGLQELLINAVEHGNLDISYAEKSALLLAGSWQEEIQKRLQLPELANRFVEVHFQRQPEKLVFTIQDQGDGFDWRDFLEFSPERVFDLHGRGIAMARMMSFDHLEYQGCGNRVMVCVNTSQH